MKFLVYISDFMIPLLVFYVVGYGILMKKNVYDDFVSGAKDGMKTVVSIVPTLIGLMVGVGVLRASGFLDALSGVLGKITEPLGVPAVLMPSVIVRMFSSSAATGLVLDLFKEYGTDSVIGLMASIMMGSTETIFYTMSVYYMAAKVTKTRWTLPGALLCTFAGIAASVIIGKMM
ncbi:spore maturation protein [Lachnospiraceae bacterium HCP1S3_C3]|nr:spore maturation protein [Lachnospiraceae bacterium]MDD6858719.1 nucleoside recognition domain-containing protein [Lachnospiraceae bacterium]